VLINGYGPTENTTFTCCHRIVETPEAGGSIPIGRPIANTQVYVLDARQRLAPIGVPGELYAAGEGLARGYLESPALTAERFVPDPFAVAPGARLYRTGDHVRYRPDGAIEFIGRIDQQVKLRGHRVEPLEIETVLRGIDAIRDAVVVVHEDQSGQKRLVAYVVAAAGAAVDAPAIREA